MPDIKIRRREGGDWQVLVDGVDLAPSIVPDGLEVRFVGGRPEVYVTTRYLEVDLDLDLQAATLHVEQV